MRRALFLAIPLALSSAACSYDNGDANRVFNTPPNCSSPSTPVQSAIDADQQIEVDAGQGAGVFVEYQTGGHWLLRTSCDTLKSGAKCDWDIIVTPEDGRSLVNVVGNELEDGDGVSAYPDDGVSYQFLASTSSDIDGFSFDSEAGAGVRVDAYLDGQCALPFFFWVGDGALHSGSPTNPVDLIPSAP